LYVPGYTKTVWFVLSWGSEARAAVMLVYEALLLPSTETMTAPAGGTLPLSGWALIVAVVVEVDPVVVGLEGEVLLGSLRL
jgi:hypothetical protein